MSQEIISYLLKSDEPWTRFQTRVKFNPER